MQTTQQLIEQIKAKEQEGALYWYKPEQHNAVIAALEVKQQEEKSDVESYRAFRKNNPLVQNFDLWDAACQHKESQLCPTITSLQAELKEKDALLKKQQEELEYLRERVASQAFAKFTNQSALLGQMADAFEAIDTGLSIVEDYAHGQEGKEITKCRKVIGGLLTKYDQLNK